MGKLTAQEWADRIQCAIDCDSDVYELDHLDDFILQQQARIDAMREVMRGGTAAWADSLFDGEPGSETSPVQTDRTDQPCRILWQADIDMVLRGDGL